MAFFSGTDTNTLKQEGNDKDNFFSLIVNNAGKYCSGITVKMNDEIKESENIYSFTDFDGSTSVYKKEPYTYKDWLVHWSEGNITIETPTHKVDFTERLEKIKEEKLKKAPRYNYTSTTTGYKPATTYSGYGPLFDADYSRRSYPSDSYSRYRDYYDHSSWLTRSHFSYSDENDLYEDKFLQLLTMSMFTNHNSKLNLASFVRMLPNMVQNRFGSESSYFNALEYYTDLVFDDCVMEDVVKSCEYILNKCKSFTTNSALESFIGWVTYYLESLKECDEEDKLIMKEMREEAHEDPYHWNTSGK